MVPFTTGSIVCSAVTGLLLKDVKFGTVLLRKQSSVTRRVISLPKLRTISFWFTSSPLGRTQRREQTSTPRQDFLRIWTLWLLVLRMAQPEVCRFASSHVGGYTMRQWPFAHSCHELYSVTYSIGGWVSRRSLWSKHTCDFPSQKCNTLFSVGAQTHCDW